MTKCRSAPCATLSRQHTADQRLPGDGPDDAVHDHHGKVQRQCMLKAAHGGIGLRSEGSVDLETLVGIAGTTAELELLLHAPHRVAAIAAFDLADQCYPRLRVDDAIAGEALAGLERLCRGRGQRTERAVDRELVAACTQQKLQCLDGVPVMSDLDHGPWAESAGHVVLLLLGQLAGPSSSSASMTSHVCAPTTPSAVMACCCCSCFTAAAVLLP